MTDFATADLIDAHPEARVAEPSLGRFGLVDRFCGPIQTVLAPEDNSLVRAQLETAGEGRVLVVDGAGSFRCALVGDNLAGLAIENGWAGIVVNGCIRDSAVIDGMEIGIQALGTNPRPSVKRDQGVVGEPVFFLGVGFEPGHWLYADADGVVVSERDIR